ncbi:hypothetical protein LTR56_019764 [Elasticomyces elasticus]|nr:hypothetical protein LTR56_019764 [Elasticomyces elasticus]KAK3642560.1 hypothetical protein LTR22_015998 [Elasticomyces elasticus]KAK5745030.1 hypothetical protein LTS12_023266 [Elasticomyces elasticus]
MAATSSKRPSLSDPDDTRARKRVRASSEHEQYEISFAGEPVKVIVGSEYPQTFYVHEAVLCMHSGFSEAACKKEWAEGHERRIVLLD